MPVSEDWARLGKLLEQRRVEVDSRYRNLSLFCRERGIDYRLAWDAEHGARNNYRSSTKIALAYAYGVVPNSLDEALHGGSLVAAGERPPAPRYDDTRLQQIWDMDLPESERLNLIALAQAMRRQREAGSGS